MMTEFNQTPEKTAESAESEQAMPAEFGLATATFVVVAGMVGAGVLTTSGYTVALVGSNQWMLFLWVLGGITAVCGALTLAELSAALPTDGRRLRLPLRSLRPVAGVLVGLGFVLHRVCRSQRGVGVCFRQIHPSTFPVSGRAHSHAGSGSWRRRRSWFSRPFTSPGRRRTAKVQGWITILKLIGAWGIRTVRSVHRLAESGQPRRPYASGW